MSPAWARAYIMHAAREHDRLELVLYMRLGLRYMITAPDRPAFRTRVKMRHGPAEHLDFREAGP